jgi:unsaturated rhamnogalacturonyl hydrolase
MVNPAILAGAILAAGLPPPAPMVVAQDGTGKYRTIQAALDSIPRGSAGPHTILVRNGTYREKLFITTSHLALVGEDRARTRVVFDELRRNWRASHADDWGAAVVNIGPEVTDLVLANLTVHNDYGARHGDHDHQFALRSMGNATRIAVLGADLLADGGDTVSLWNADSGLSYFADCAFSGWVDFFCPRGTAYVTGSRFFGHDDSASLWHDGSRDRRHKLVVRHSSFDGVPGFPLGRYHRDAQFYLLEAAFSAHMGDRPIYAVPSAPEPPRWGTRVYYSACRREGGELPWFADNLREAAGAPRDEDVTAAWTFGGQWDPEALPAVLPFAAIPGPEDGWPWADAAGVTLRWTPAREARAQRLYFGTSDPPPFRAEQAEATYATGPLTAGATYHWRVDTVTAAGVVPGRAWSFRTDPRAVRIALAGDSTVTEEAGWGRGFKARIAESAAVLNAARGGRSSKSYAAEGHWADVLRRKPSHVLLQFGHNDMPGKGAERETDAATYRANMARYVDEARAAGASPVMVTSLTRRRFTPEGRVDSDLGVYVDAARSVAAEKAVPLIDLHAKSIALLEAMGEARALALGPRKPDGTVDKTHLEEEGSALFGSYVAEELGRVVPALASQVRPAAAKPWSARMADSVMARTPDSMMLDAVDAPRWEYTPGLVLKAVLDVYERTGEERYWRYVKAYYDGMIDAQGHIGGGYAKDDYNIDRINPGKPLFALYAKTKDAKYRLAIEKLRQQMREHPRTQVGGFWHKKRYPSQMWLDGLYMGAPFLAQYAAVFGEKALFDDVVKQFVLMEQKARDEKTGLLYHGWDESRQQKWSDPRTGRSPAFWGRAMGWYAMGLVETLDFVPRDHPGRAELIAILGRLAAAVTRVQDGKSGVWYQVVDQGAREGNYLEASVSSMLAFALLKASRLGYVDAKYGEAGRRAYEGILKEFIEVGPDGLVNINRVCQVAGLGGDPEKGERYREGTFQYYVTEKIRSNDPKGVGPFIFAALEMERK